MKSRTTITLAILFILKMEGKCQNVTNRSVYGHFQDGYDLFYEVKTKGCNTCDFNYNQPYHMVFQGWTDTVTWPGTWIGSFKKSIAKSIRLINEFQDTTTYFAHFLPADEIDIPLIVQGIDSLYGPLTNSIVEERQLVSDTGLCYLNGRSVIYSDLNNHFMRYDGRVSRGDVEICDSTLSGFGVSFTIDKQVIFKESSTTSHCNTQDYLYKGSIDSIGFLKAEVYDFQIGDEFLFSHYNGTHSPNGTWNSDTDFEKWIITDRIQTGMDSILYLVTYRFLDYDYNGQLLKDTIIYSYPLPIAIDGFIELEFPDPTITTSYLPQNVNTVWIKENCGIPELSWNTNYSFLNQNYSIIEEFSYGKGIGRSGYYKSQSTQYETRSSLVYFKKGGLECGQNISLGGVNENRTRAIGIYPTIVQSTLFVSIENLNPKTTIVIFNELGQLVDQEKRIISKGDKYLEIDLSSYTQGNYFIGFEMKNGENKFFRFFKE